MLMLVSMHVMLHRNLSNLFDTRRDLHYAIRPLMASRAIAPGVKVSHKLPCCSRMLSWWMERCTSMMVARSCPYPYPYPSRSLGCHRWLFQWSLCNCYAWVSTIHRSFGRRTFTSNYTWFHTAYCCCTTSINTYEWNEWGKSYGSDSISCLCVCMSYLVMLWMSCHVTCFRVHLIKWSMLKMRMDKVKDLEMRWHITHQHIITSTQDTWHMTSATWHMTPYDT